MNVARVGSTEPPHAASIGLKQRVYALEQFITINVLDESDKAGLLTALHLLADGIRAASK